VVVVAGFVEVVAVAGFAAALEEQSMVEEVEEVVEVA
jgi:hypothetical protein